MTQRIGIETPNGMVYLGEMCEYATDVSGWAHRGVIRSVVDMLGTCVTIVGSDGFYDLNHIRPIPQKTVRPMTDDEILDLAEDPKVWFRLSHESTKTLRRLSNAYIGSFGLKLNHMNKASDIRYTRDRGKTWHKLEVEE